MKAIAYSQYGSPEELHLKQVDKPVPQNNDVLVKIHASSINSWDMDLLKGKPFLVRMLGGLFKPKNQILGADIAGIVEAVGKDVKDFKAGDPVFGDIAEDGFGGFAEYVAVREKLLAKKSSMMSFEEAAALPQAGLLAVQGFRYGKGIHRGDEVLINGAGGGVGTLALQYAKSIGARVTCVDKAEKFELLRSLGADHCTDYLEEDYTRTGKLYDFILDVIAHRSIADYKRALKPGGTFAMLGGSMGGLLAKLMFFGRWFSLLSGKKLGIMGYRPGRIDLDLLSKLFEENKVRPVIDRIYALEEVPDAFRYFASGDIKGKIVIRILS